MIIVKYEERTSVLQGIEERLKEMTLDYRLEQAKVSDITLEDGMQVAIGKASIQEYLDQLASELKQWYYCSC